MFTLNNVLNFLMESKFKKSCILFNNALGINIEDTRGKLPSCDKQEILHIKIS